MRKTFVFLATISLLFCLGCIFTRSTDSSDETLVPAGITTNYDTLNGSVRLKWNKIPDKTIKGYLLYRSFGLDGNPKLINADSPILDTFFTHTLNGKTTINDEIDVSYRLKSQDLNSVRSMFSLPSAVIHIVSPNLVRTFLTFEYPSNYLDTLNIGNSAIVRVNF